MSQALGYFYTTLLATPDTVTL